jgi:hypothetical protein
MGGLTTQYAAVLRQIGNEWHDLKQISRLSFQNGTPQSARFAQEALPESLFIGIAGDTLRELTEILSVNTLLRDS